MMCVKGAVVRIQFRGELQVVLSLIVASGRAMNFAGLHEQTRILGARAERAVDHLLRLGMAPCQMERPSHSRLR